jgi:hypothetical protein
MAYYQVMPTLFYEAIKSEISQPVSVLLRREKFREQRIDYLDSSGQWPYMN